MLNAIIMYYKVVVVAAVVVKMTQVPVQENGDEGVVKRAEKRMTKRWLTWQVPGADNGWHAPLVKCFRARQCCRRSLYGRPVSCVVICQSADVVGLVTAKSTNVSKKCEVINCSVKHWRFLRSSQCTELPLWESGHFPQDIFPPWQFPLFTWCRTFPPSTTTIPQFAI